MVCSSKQSDRFKLSFLSPIQPTFLNKSSTIYCSRYKRTGWNLRIFSLSCFWITFPEENSISQHISLSRTWFCCFFLISEFEVCRNQSNSKAENNILILVMSSVQLPLLTAGGLTWCVPVVVVTAAAGGMLVYTLDVVKQEPDWGCRTIIQNVQQPKSTIMVSFTEWNAVWALMEVVLAGLSPQRSRIAKAERCREHVETHRERER